MNTLDLIILVIVLVGLARGFSTGGIRQVLSLAGILLALSLSARVMGTIGNKLTEIVGVPESFAPILGFIVAFLGIELVVFGVSRLLESVLKALSLGILNRILGGAVGGFKALLLLSLVFFVGAYLGLPGADTQRESMFYRSVSSVLPETWKYVSGRLPALDEIQDPGDMLEQVGKEESTSDT